MPSTAQANGDQPTHQTKTIDDLFGLSDEPHDDPFNELGGDEPVDEAADGAVAAPAAVEIEEPRAEAEEDDPFAGIGGASGEDPEQEPPVEAEAPSYGEPDQAELAEAELEEPGVEVAALEVEGLQNDAEEDDPFAGIGEAMEEETVQELPDEPEAPTPEVDQAELDRQKYYNDLLAEFEDDVPASDAREAVGDGSVSPPVAAQSVAQLPPPVQALFGEDDTPFDEFLGGAGTQTPPGTGSAPDLSIENSPVRPHPGDTSVQSLFSNASDWLDDTTMDESFVNVRGEEQQATETKVPAVPVEEEEVDVPEGWIDEYGNFEYYTPEDREAVRQTMLAERATARASAPIVPPSQPTPYSENAARRTPQPDQSARFASPPPQAPYAPPVFSRHSTGLPTPSIQPQPDYNAYSPAPSQPNSAYTPVSSSQTSYFPPTQPAGRAAAYDPYAPQSSSSYAQPTPPSTQRGGSKPTPPKPQPPQRVVSNAYDPPFLRPQKSFIRPATAAPLTSAFPPMPTQATPPAAAPAPLPPSGPPRRTPSVPPMSTLGLSRLSKPVPESPSAYEPSQPSPYDANSYSASAPPTSFGNAPPSRPTSQASQRPKAVPNAFDPPLRPPSVSRAASQLTFTPPPPVPPMPPASLPPPPSGPSRPSSRGGQKRATPMFEAPPPMPPNRVPTVSAPQDEYRQPVMPPPRALTPEQRTAKERRESGVPRDAGWPHLTGSTDDDDDEMGQAEPGSESSRPEVSHSLRGMEDEEDQEGGQWREDEDDRDASRQMDVDEDDGYTAPPSASRPPPTVIPPVQQPPRQAPAPVVRQASYDPYAPSSSAPAQNAYAPSARGPDSPSTPKQDHHSIPNLTSPPKTRPPIPTAFSAPVQDPYAPSSSSSYQPTPSFEAPHQPYQPAAISIPIQPPTPYIPSSDPYAPGGSSIPNTYAPTRSLSPAQASLYAPNRTHSPAHSSHLSASPQDNTYFQSMHMDTSYVPQQVLEQRPLSEDPLGRSTLSAKNAPLAIFGFGGVLVTAFPASAEDSGVMGHNRTPSYGYASGRGQLLIRPLGTILENLGKGVGGEFPGPLLLDPSNPKGSAGDKKKKESVLAYLENRAEEIEKGLPYLKSSASGARREEEGKLLLVRLLSALVIGEGKFSGSPKVDEAMKKALAPPSESHPLITPGHLGSTPFSLAPSSAPFRPLSAPGQLSTLSSLLVGGDKRDAIEYAAAHGMWSHALVIASSLGPEFWKETMGRFVKEEMANEQVAGLKASYALFAGSDASIGMSSQRIRLIVVDELYAAANITTDPSKDQWREVIASVVFNGRPADLACLDDLGGRFSQRGLLNVAHACALLSSTSPFVDPGPTAFDRPVSLLQDRNTDATLFAEIAEYARSMIPVPKGLEVPFPGLPALLPYKLQRAWQAAEQGDVDLAKRYCNAVEAATKLAKTGPPLIPLHHISSLEDLLERLTGSPSINPAKGLSARKQAAKPGLDKLGSWIGGRITTFIAGEDDDSSAITAPKVVPTAKGTLPAGVVGPFSHFSTISPAPSTDVSRNGSVNDFAASTGNGYLGVGSRSGTAPFGLPSPQAEHPPSGGYTAWGSEPAEERENGDTAQGGDGVAELLTPMAAMTFGGPSSSDAYAPKKPAMEEEDDEDDLGFGNAGLSRDRTPKPAESDDKASSTKKGAETAAKPDEGSTPSKDEAAKGSGWFKGWFGKKDGEAGPGPIRAKLGEENAMVFDKELKRWVVKGQKPEAAPALPPPPPRSQTVSPSKASRPSSSANGPPQAPFATMPRSVSGSGPPSTRNAPPQPRSGLAESVTAEQAPPAAAALSTPAAPPGPGGMGRPPGGPPGMPRPPQGASIDDLLSRPPSKRPASAASRKGAKNRYVDVFQQPQDK